MAAPADARANRWNAVVNAIVTLGAQQTPPQTYTTAEVDTWLNALWLDGSHENDRNDLRDLCVGWLEANAPTAGTLRQALRQYCA